MADAPLAASISRHAGAARMSHRGGRAILRFRVDGRGSRPSNRSRTRPLHVAASRRTCGPGTVNREPTGAGPAKMPFWCAFAAAHGRGRVVAVLHGRSLVCFRRLDGLRSHLPHQVVTSISMTGLITVSRVSGFCARRQSGSGRKPRIRFSAATATGGGRGASAKRGTEISLAHGGRRDRRGAVANAAAPSRRKPFI